MNMQGRPNGNGRQPCSKGCGLKSIAGLRKGQGLCPYHWAELMWGTAYADRCHPAQAPSPRGKVKVW